MQFAADAADAASSDACSAHLDAIADACLDVFRALPGTKYYAGGPGACQALPVDSLELREAAGFFYQSMTSRPSTEPLGQHLFDVELWDDALAALARALSEHNTSLAVEVGHAVCGGATLLLLSQTEQTKLIEELGSSLASARFLSRRIESLAATRRPRGSPSASVPDAYSFARERRRKQDYVAVPPELTDEEAVIGTLYDCALRELGPSLMRRLGLPASVLGLRTFVAATRASGTQRAAALFGHIWHAAPEPAPLIFRGAVSAPLMGIRAANDSTGRASGCKTAQSGARTLVVVFSSLGWRGVVRAEWGATLRDAADDDLHVAHALDTAQSWFLTDPTTGEYDDGDWWDRRLSELCAPYDRVCLLGESMGASAALRFARHATGSIVALVPQIDVRDFEYAGRADFTDERKARLRDEIACACTDTRADVVLHVGEDPPDLRQLDYLPQPTDAFGMRVVNQDAHLHTPNIAHPGCAHQM